MTLKNCATFRQCVTQPLLSLVSEDFGYLIIVGSWTTGVVGYVVSDRFQRLQLGPGAIETRIQPR